MKKVCRGYRIDATGIRVEFAPSWVAVDWLQDTERGSLRRFYKRIDGNALRTDVRKCVHLTLAKLPSRHNDGVTGCIHLIVNGSLHHSIKYDRLQCLIK
jgi:hypothetical protein